MAELDPRFAIHHLDNGLTVLFERMADAPSAAAGFLVRTGARDETPAIQGVSHFLEHMMFKGTAKRSAFQINVDFDEMGAEYNAYTGNEETMYFGWVRPAELPRLLELLADMMRSVMPPDDFETEKKVILEEIAMYEDHLESYTVDQLLTRGFGAHPLGGSVLGSVETVSALTRDQMDEYFQARYTPENMLLVVCGNFDPDATLSEIESLCGEWTRANATRQQLRPKLLPGEHVILKDRFQRQTLCLAFDAPPAADKLADDADIAAAVLGRPDNSRLFWQITQKGLAQTARAFYWHFTDAGLFILYAAVDPAQAPDVLARLRDEAERLQSEGPTEDEIIRVRNGVQTQFALQAEAPFDRLLQVAEDMEVFGAPRTPRQRLDELGRVTPDTVRAFLEAYPLTGPGTLVSVGPRGELE